MFDLLFNPLTRNGLYLLALAQGFLRYRNPQRREVWRYRVAFYDLAWREAAEAIGAEWKDLGSGITEITFGDFRTRVMDNSSAIDDPVTLALLSDKPLTYGILEAERLPTPPHATFRFKKPGPAIEFLRKSGGFGWLKPAGGPGGGRSITTGVRTRTHLARAAAAAAVYCDDLLIEQQVPGDNYRLLYLDGVLIDAFVRRPPTVTGDGRSSVADLVRRENDERLRRGAGKSQALLAIDLDMRRTLAGQGLSLGAVPPAGTEVVLKTVVNDNCGDDNRTVTDVLHPSVVADGARAVRALGVRLAGVDLIMRDPAVPLAESGGVFLEVNAPPNFYYHYHKPDGPFPVAVHVLRKLLADHGSRAGLPARQDTDPVDTEVDVVHAG